MGSTTTYLPEAGLTVHHGRAPRPTTSRMDLVTTQGAYQQAHGRAVVNRMGAPGAMRGAGATNDPVLPARNK